MRRSLVIAAFLLVFQSVAQVPAPYFSLNSDRTFAPGEKPRISFTSQNVDALDFRVYRVNDPVAFFRQLPEPHGFGGQAPPVPPSKTLLEQIHRWKQRTRYSMRRTVREQFGDEEHQTFMSWLGRTPRTPQKGLGGDQFAEVPLLNPQQLVKTWRVPVSKKDPWDSQSVDFDVPGSGLYIVEAVANGLRAATIVNVTPIALLKKVAPGKVITQVVDRTTGEVMQGVSLHLVKDADELTSLKTNGDGFAEFPLALEGEATLTLIARNGNDTAVASIESWALNQRKDRVAIGYIYTDRPVYRPGDKVGFRGILRAEDEAGWKLPDVKEVRCEISDPEGKTIFKRSINLSEFGTVAGDWSIPKSAALGYYSVMLYAGESAQSGSFQVEEYKKPEYEVKVTSPPPRLLQGEGITFNVDAKYYFGEPVAGARVHYVVRTTRHWNWFWGDYDPDDDNSDGGDSTMDFYGQQVLEADAKLDAQGKLAIHLPTKRFSSDVDYRIQVGVTDEAKREVTGRGMVLATVGTFVLQAEPEKYVYSPGENIRLRVEARNYDGKLLPGISFRHRGISATTGSNGEALIDAGTLGPGSHKLIVTSGRVTSEAYVWVSGSISSNVSENRITLVPDKKSYKPGDTAKVLVVTGMKNTNVLIGVEGRTLHKSEVKKVSDTSFIYEVPIRSDHAPNVFLTAAFLQDGKYYFGSKSLKVPPTEKLINVSVTPSSPQFKPGQPASYTIEAKDHQGKPVAAEFSLGVVDEAVYGVQPESIQSIDKAFYGRIYDRVFTDSSLNYYFYGQAGKRAMPIARNARQHVLAQVKPPNPNDPRVRKIFDDTALWLATVKTDNNGRAQAKLQFPDSITAWRATARGVTRDTKVGSAVNRVVTRKDLILRLATPRFITEGDEVVISAIVNNYLEGEKLVRVSLDAAGLESLDGTTREGTALPKAETAFHFRVRAKGAELATLTAKAITNEESDALELTLPIEPYGVKITKALSGMIANSGSTEQTIAFPSDSTGRAIELRAMPSMAGAIFGALEYLTSYPYGCTEQTLSSFVPTTLVDSALRELNLQGMDRVRLQKQIDAGLDRLADFQHADGGWGFWQSDDSAPFMTANVIASLDQCDRWGRVNQEKAKAWLRQSFTKEQRASADFRAFLAYALNEPGPLDEVWKQKDQLSPYGLALIGLRSTDQRAVEIADRLEKSAVVTDSEAHWKLDHDPLMEIDWDSSPDATASALKFLTRVRPQSPLLPKAAVWLVNHRDTGYYWSSTKQTATVIYGLIDYLKLSGELSPKLTGEIKVNGESVWHKELTQADALTLQIPGLRVLPKQPSNKVEIDARGTGRLYWSASSIHYDAKPQFWNSRELNIRREYFRVIAGGQKVAFDGVAKPGDEIISRLTVSGDNWRYLVIEDPIPAGAEWVKENRWWGTHKELRDNRAAIFETYFNRTQTYETRMKFTRPGKYRISPARVSPMYQPNVMAASDPASVEVLP